jgi:hypothetical protein
LSRDKALAKKILSYHRIRGADFVVIPRERTVGGRGGFASP